MTEAAKPTPSLRAQHAEMTRELILRALVERFEQEELSEISVPAVAAAAGVSLRTVYRYFPTREELLRAGAEWMAERVLGRPLPRTLDDVLAAGETMKQFGEHPRLVRALVATETGQELRSVRRARLRDAVADALQGVTRNLPEDERRRAVAVIALLDSMQAWFSLHEVYGLEGEESGQALEWALQTLIDDLRRRNDAAASGNAGSANGPTRRHAR